MNEEILRKAAEELAAVRERNLREQRRRFEECRRLNSRIFDISAECSEIVAEIVRAGILAVDRGQMEAGRSLGLPRLQTMIYIILPQAIKNILPALGNEFITVIKETSIAGYIPITDLTKAGDIVRSRTYEPFFALIMVALIYFVLVWILTQGLRALERKLAKNDRR